MFQTNFRLLKTCNKGEPKVAYASQIVARRPQQVIWRLLYRHPEVENGLIGRSRLRIQKFVDPVRHVAKPTAFAGAQAGCLQPGKRTLER